MLAAMRLKKVLEVLDEFAPQHLAEDWDKVGMHVGDPAWPVRRAMLCIDMTEPVMAEAVRKKVNLIVAYHPPIFQPIKRLANESQADWKPRIIIEAIQRRIAIYSPHTALDAAPDGVNQWLCDGIGQGHSEVVEPPKSSLQENSSFKIVTYVPANKAAAVRSAMAEAGGGHIGNYEACSFNILGHGTFRGSADTDPFVGKAGRLETVDELRIEMACGTTSLANVVAAARHTHPYEEPAFDIYPTTEPPPACEQVGQGRLLTLNQPVSAKTLVGRIKKHLHLSHLQVATPPGGDHPGRITTVAVCPGAGWSIIKRVANSADAYLTGEMRHHDVIEAVAQGKIVILAGHTQTERPYLAVYRHRIVKQLGPGVQWLISRTDQPPTKMI